MASRATRVLDELDWRILARLQADARISFSELGRQVGLSAPAAIERIRRMEDVGVITGYHLGLDVGKLGYAVEAVIRVSAPEEHCVRLGVLVQTLPGVIESHRVTGTDRLILKIAASSIADLDGILRQLSRYGTATASVILSSKSRTIPPPARPRDRGRQTARARPEDEGRAATVPRRVRRP